MEREGLLHNYYLLKIKPLHVNKIKKKEKIKKEVDLILHLIDFQRRGWRLKMAKLLNTTPQRSGDVLKKYYPEIYNSCYKHSDRK